MSNIWNERIGDYQISVDNILAASNIWPWSKESQEQVFDDLQFQSQGAELR